ncbi:hypothetical protein [Micromonospora sp. NPDC004704]
MSRNLEPITVATLQMAAGLTIRQHQPGGNTWNPGTCWQCTPTGCPQLAWAHEVRDGGAAAYPVPARS